MGKAKLPLKNSSLIERTGPDIYLTDFPLADKGLVTKKQRQTNKKLLRKNSCCQEGILKVTLGICVTSKKYGGLIIKSLEEMWFTSLPGVLKAMCPIFHYPIINIIVKVTFNT